MTTDDPFDLARFTQAQEPAYAAALEELREGRKRTHWMWFIFPQLRGLGASPTSHFYGIGSLEEARAYLGHPVLGTRLSECTEAVLAADRPLRDLLGSPDDLKFRSSMTLFSIADPMTSLYIRALRHFWDGQPDAATLALLASEAGNRPLNLRGQFAR